MVSMFLYQWWGLIIISASKFVSIILFGKTRSMKVRRAIIDDASRLAKIHVDSWRAAYRGLVPDTHLCKHAEKMLKEQGHTTIFLWVFSLNQRARRFYEAMGFKTDGGTKMLNSGIPLVVIRYRKRIERG